jgi:hypothetical protein
MFAWKDNKIKYSMMNICQLSNDDDIRIAAFNYKNKLKSASYIGGILFIAGILSVSIMVLSAFYSVATDQYESVNPTIHYAYLSKNGVDIIYVGENKLNKKLLTAKEAVATKKSQLITYPGIVVQDENAVNRILDLSKKLGQRYTMEGKLDISVNKLHGKVRLVDQELKLNSMKMLKTDIHFMVKNHIAIPAFVRIRDNYVTYDNLKLPASVYNHEKKPDSQVESITVFFGFMSAMFFIGSFVLFSWVEFSIRKYNKITKNLLIDGNCK